MERSSRWIREQFLDFFRKRDHLIVPSAPIVIKDDPTLMFTNAGMNQFKDYFLGTRQPPHPRIADTQKCLRVSGKHNDLEEVGRDTYHHTMFEMLGNWSFGDYFKKEAIHWAWELLTDVYKIPHHRLYPTVFGGDDEDDLPPDEESIAIWSEITGKERVLRFSKKDNFWEMGDTGPCGPCSEIHIDLRDDFERKREPGKKLVNTGHPLVIELWNLVFIQYNRKADGSLELLPDKHVDTGMGFERLCMVLQGKRSSYDTDIFQPLIAAVEAMCQVKYPSTDENINIAVRVAVDHIRAIAFSIADGQIPSNTGAGYVIRRLLRRAVRYGYSYLNRREPFLYRLVEPLVAQFEHVFPEVKQQKKFIETVLHEEESSFLKTLEKGMQLLEQVFKRSKDKKIIDGKTAFELYDTYGFPIDLTQLIAGERGFTVDMEGFRQHLLEQKERARKATEVETDDWIVIRADDQEEFIGYDRLEADVYITRYRKISVKGKTYYQLVFNVTPFYPEGGGQVGDTGVIEAGGEVIQIIDTRKENELIVHFTRKLPTDVYARFHARVDAQKRMDTASNHSATHLLHYALKKVLGPHVEQRGSLVAPDYLRFDFSHYAKMTEEELEQVEREVNRLIRRDIHLKEYRGIPKEEAMAMGAVALFGEKYGDVVRVIRFDESVELCGGTHVPSTGVIGLFKIVSESAIAAGIRRIEAVTGERAYDYVTGAIKQLKEVQSLLKQPDVIKAVNQLLEENSQLRKRIQKLEAAQVNTLKKELTGRLKSINDIHFGAELIELDSADAIKQLAFDIRKLDDRIFLLLGARLNGKAHLTLVIGDKLVQEKSLNAGTIIRQLAQHIKGGGGGQPFYATAGGKNPEGLLAAIKAAEEYVKSLE